MDKKTFKKIILVVLAIFLIWFLFLRTTKLTITYDGVETVSDGYGAVGATYSAKSLARNTAAVPEIAMANVLSTDALYEEADFDAEMNAPERYRENRYYRVDTSDFDNLVEKLTDKIKQKDGTIKINEQNSNRRQQFDKEFYPRYQSLEFTIPNTTENVDEIEEVLKKYGNIRIANTNQSSIEQELVSYEQQLKEMEAARKALQESKDRDRIAKQDSDLAKRSEKLKNQIENAKKQSEYKTYTINIYEMIYFRVNSIRYWYSNNYLLKNAIANSLPSMVDLFAKLIPVALILIILALVLDGIIRNNKKKNLEEQIKQIESIKNKNVHFDIKL